MTAQAQIAAAVADRGYLNGYTPEQLLARQLAKLTEESGELASLLTGSPPVHVPLRPDVGAPALQALHVLGGVMRNAFDRGDWQNAQIVGAPEAVWSELCDIGVVWAVACAAWCAWQGIERDGVAGALAKATQDIQRGVRA